MNDATALSLLSAMAQATRFSAYRLLLRHQPDGLPVGTIAQTLNAAQNTLSTHMQILSEAGFTVAERRGRQIIYRAAPEQWRRLNAFMTGAADRSDDGPTAADDDP